MTIVALTVGCNRSELLRPEVGTKWESQEGYSVELGGDGVYTFCDNRSCFQDNYTRPGARDSIAIVLKNFYHHPETTRLRRRLESLGDGHSDIKLSYPDLEFTQTGGLAPEKWCNDNPCVLFGSVTTQDHLIFYKR